MSGQPAQGRGIQLQPAAVQRYQVDRDGRIEIECRDADGREIEVRSQHQQGESGATDVERD